MGSVYRETFTKPLPGGAEILTRKGQRIARWKDKTGKTRTAPVTVGKDGSERITVTSRTFTAKYRDGGRLVRKVATGCRDETAARRVLADLERRAELVKSGVVTAGEDAVASHQNKPLSDHIAAFLEHQEAKNLCATQLNDTRSRLDRIAADCSFRRLADLNGAALERWLVARKAEGMSARTRNCYRQAWVTFGNWAARNSRLLSNPFAAVPKADEKADPRRKRRAMEESELNRLLAVATLRPLAELGRLSVRKDKGEVQRQRDTWKWERLTYDGLGAAAERARDRLRDNPALVAKLQERGRERALIYKTLVLTGLRKGELASLTVTQLDLDHDPPYLTLDCADEKNREGNSLVIRSDLALELRDWLADKATAFQQSASSEPTVKFDPEAAKPSKCVIGDSKGRNRQSCQDWTALPPNTLVFDVPAGLLRILNRDLRAAGIPKRDERGRTVDVHAMRTTFGTLLSAAGVYPRTAQAAMRHSTIDLTMNIYTDPKLLDIQGAIESLPNLSLHGDDGRTIAATGTDGDGFPLVPPLVPELGGNADDASLSCQFLPISQLDATASLADDELAVSGCQDTTKKPLSILDNGCQDSRGGEIRTLDLLLPKQAR